MATSRPPARPRTPAIGGGRPAPRLTSTWARAVVPVAGGIAFFALLGLFLWGVAALISDGDGASDDLVSRTFTPGSTQQYARLVDEGGPILFPDLIGDDGDESYVLDHVGDDPTAGWRLFLAHPADRPLSCKVTQVRGTRQFTDCEGRTIDVADLALPPCGVGPAVTADGRTLDLDLRPTAEEQCAAPVDSTPPTSP